jgi:ribonucleoside-diphosphate reductase alpha chain
MSDMGVPNEPHSSKPQDMSVFSFPTKLGSSTVTREQVTAIQHLELVKLYNLNWSEHAVSCTVSVMEHEWPEVGGWVYKNFDLLAGVSFLPHFAADSTYTQLPYETIDKRTYEELVKQIPEDIDWSQLELYEKGIDTVEGIRDFACLGNMCEVVEASQPIAAE